MEHVDALVIGAGPAGLMAAQMLAEAGRRVTVIEAKPSPARKFLMAGKSGLNLTKDEGFEPFLAQFEEAASPLRPILQAFDSQAVQQWATDLGQELFSGSSGRVFPVCMKASPLLRAWLAKLQKTGVEIRRNWYWQGFEDEDFLFNTAAGTQQLQAAVTVLALGGASWSRLGSDGQWTTHLSEKNIAIDAFAPANAGLRVHWSSYMNAHFGAPIKNCELKAGRQSSRGEFVISASGLEGGGIYSISKAVREGHELSIDLFPDLSQETLKAKISRPRGKMSLSNHLRKCIALQGAKMALLQEVAKPLTSEVTLAHTLKNLVLPHAGLSDIDQAISSAGGVSFEAMNNNLMLKNLPGVFCAGEMLDWEAPTGGYLLTASLATGRWAGAAAAAFNKC